MTWTGYDGSVWDITNYRSGVVLLPDGVEGLHNPEVEKYRSSSRAIPGDRLRGSRTKKRDVFWKIHIWSDGSAQWLARQDAFWRSIHPTRPGTWAVTAGGKTRTLQCTGMFDDSYPYVVDPLRRGWAQYPVALEAVQPYWAGETVTFGPWQAAPATPFITEGGAPPFHLGSARAFGKAKASNAGDVDVWPEWTARGPFDAGVRFGVAGVTVEVPFAIPSGEDLIVITDPRRPSATLAGTDVTEPLGLQSYARVPTGESVSLEVSGTGGGSISAQLTPLYFRAL